MTQVTGASYVYAPAGSIAPTPTPYYYSGSYAPYPAATPYYQPVANFNNNNNNNTYVYAPAQVAAGTVFPTSSATSSSYPVVVRSAASLPYPSSASSTDYQYVHNNSASSPRNYARALGMSSPHHRGEMLVRSLRDENAETRSVNVGYTPAIPSSSYRSYSTAAGAGAPLPPTAGYAVAGGYLPSNGSFVGGSYYPTGGSYNANRSFESQGSHRTLDEKKYASAFPRRVDDYDVKKIPNKTSFQQAVVVLN